MRVVTINKIRCLIALSHIPGWINIRIFTLLSPRKLSHQCPFSGTRNIVIATYIANYCKAYRLGSNIS